MKGCRGRKGARRRGGGRRRRRDDVVDESDINLIIEENKRGEEGSEVEGEEREELKEENEVEA